MYIAQLYNVHKYRSCVKGRTVKQYELFLHRTIAIVIIIEIVLYCVNAIISIAMEILIVISK